MILAALLLFGIIGSLLGGLFALESLRDKESRAFWTGFAVFFFFMITGTAALWLPELRTGIGVCYLAIGSVLLTLFIPAPPNVIVRKGAAAFAVGPVIRIDERDIVFARNRSLPPGSDIYRNYYQKHPEKEARDARRRNQGGPVGPMGVIDNGYPPNVAMIEACFEIPPIFGPHAEKEPAGGFPPETSPDPAKASRIVKGLAAHLGADLVGICRVNPDWAYSHRGEIFFQNWGDWGKEIPDPLPFAVVIAVEMDRELVGAAPHTPTLFESAHNYGKGAYITTILTRWFAGMGYKAAAQHSRHYDLNMVPLAIDAGLGELGRLGFLIADRFGPRVRLFAVTTDMPLVSDRPVDLGVDRFCQTCLKCAEACPSKAIPAAGKVSANGIEKWRMDAERCFDFWAKAGTDCSICMGICPFSRPHRGFHRLARFFIRYCRVAQEVFPHLDNLIYGRRWHSRSAPGWIDFQNQRDPFR